MVERMSIPTFETEVKDLLESIHLEYGYDFRHYAPASMKRTLLQGMDRLECRTIPALQEKILRDSESFINLLQSLTIAVSEMFRDPSFFFSLRENVVPLLKTYPSLKIWVAGCSTGEEVYSLAILLQEEELLDRTILYATDINPRSLEKAKAGVYGLKEIQGYAQNYQLSGGKRSLTDYYTPDRDTVRFDRALTNNVTFTDHSLVTDSVFSETHLISCRNVLIYFDRELQNRAFSLFHESLNRKCFLGLGSQETIRLSKYEKYFDHFDKRERIFQKK